MLAGTDKQIARPAASIPSLMTEQDADRSLPGRAGAAHAAQGATAQEVRRRAVSGDGRAAAAVTKRITGGCHLAAGPAEGSLKRSCSKHDTARVLLRTNRP
ncbi:unnamed protein product [Heligmosomoides polygyrus]|uniref:Uncharacterized protein n=1 Tax=Heligmosomoides polygyrus TaxID=6339 RepID=A0A183G2E1_HELPZ|nr:unnamed protein product [Heligmosomoides polygyrus]